MIKQQINPPEMKIKFGRSGTTLTALSACRQRPASVPSTCRHPGRQRLLQETGHHAIGKSIDDRKDHGRKRINFAEICAITTHTLNSIKTTSSEVQE